MNGQIFFRKHSNFMTLDQLKQHLGDINEYTFNIITHDIGYNYDIHNAQIKSKLRELRQKLKQEKYNKQMIPDFLRDKLMEQQIKINKLQSDILQLQQHENELIMVNKDKFLESISPNVSSMLIKNNNHPNLLGGYNGSKSLDILQCGELFAIYELRIPDNIGQFQKQVNAGSVLFEHSLSQIGI